MPIQGFCVPDSGTSEEIREVDSSKFLICIFIIINLVLNFFIFEYLRNFSWFRRLFCLSNLSVFAVAARDPLCWHFVKVDRGRHAIYFLEYV